MTESLGENFDALRVDLKKYYPDKVFGLCNRHTAVAHDSLGSALSSLVDARS